MSIAADVVTYLAACRKAVLLYPASHPAYIEALDGMVAAVTQATQDGPFVLNVYEGHLYHDSVVLPPDAHGATSIAEAFEERRVESLAFQPGFTSDDALGLTEVLSMRPSPELDVIAELVTRGVYGVVVSKLEDDSDEEKAERDRQREADRAMYRRVISALRTLREQFSAGGSADLSGTTGLVAGVIERLASNPSAVLGLATLKSQGDHALFHSLNVTIYTLAAGQHLGLSEEDLASLGLAALLHDTGKAAFVEGDPTQAEPMRLMHPEVGAEILQRVALDDPAPMLVAYEHHMHHDGGGWPVREEGRVPHPYSRMVAVADVYANLTNPPAGIEALTPDRAIATVLSQAGSVLDPFFARLFAGALGAFPVGCMVRLSDQSVGVVSATTTDALAPVVRIAFDTDGAELADPFELDLTEADVAILEVIDPEALAVEVADKL